MRLLDRIKKFFHPNVPKVGQLAPGSKLKNIDGKWYDHEGKRVSFEKWEELAREERKAYYLAKEKERNK